MDRLLKITIMDYRRVPLDLGYGLRSCIEMDNERIILGFKQLTLKIDSQFPIVQEEREAMTYLLSEVPTLKYQDDHEISDILDNPTLGSRSISSVCGHVIGVYYFPIKFTSSNHSKLLSSLTQLQHLRSLSLRISGGWEDQEHFYEELGDQLGSKLVHLEIRASFEIQSLDLLSNQMFKFSSLKKLKLSIDSIYFNPSLEVFNHLWLCID